MGTDNLTNNAVSGRLRKAKMAGRMARNRSNKYIDDDPQLKIIPIRSLIGSILFYSLHIQPLPHTQIANLQSFHSGRIRRIAQKRYSELEQKPISNYEIREQYNIPTIESKLKYYSYKQYASWGTTLYRIFKQQ